MKQIDVKFQSEKKRDRTYSPFGGALLVANIFEMLGIANAIDLHVGARRANSGVKYTDSIYVKCITLMQIIGGDTVDGLQIIREDPVLSKSLGAIPGRTSFHNYLSSFADEAQEAKRGQGKSVILTPNAHLKGFDGVTRHCLSVMPSFSEMETVTLDQDATFIPTGVDGALYNYKSEKSFQALNTYCPEYDMVIRSEFRDGNVPPGQQQLEQLKKSLELLPDPVRKVRLRSDTAGYQIELLRYCAQGDNERFSVIGFAVGSPVTAAFKAAVSITKASEWRRVDDNRECAVVSFAPNSLSCSKKGPEYRFIAMREVLCEHSGSASAQRFLFPDEEHGGVSSLHPMSMNGKIYKVFALVTNIIDLPPEEIVRWYHLRCGKSEHSCNP